MWFSQCEVRLLAKTTTKKFTSKDGIQNSEKKIIEKPKPLYTQIFLSHKIFFPKEKTKTQTSLLQMQMTVMSFKMAQIRVIALGGYCA